MDNLDENCKHGQITRNCYSCYLHRNDNEPVNFQDMIFSTLSELKIRIAKLEQYKLLQDDINKYSHIVIGFCDEQRKKQIDENRAVEKYLTRLEEDNAELNSRQNDLSEDVEMLKGWHHSSHQQLFGEPKTTGLTFEEAITAFKVHKKIQRKHWIGTISYKNESLYFAIEDVFANDWEIVE